MFIIGVSVLTLNPLFKESNPWFVKANTLTRVLNNWMIIDPINVLLSLPVMGGGQPND